MSTVRLVSAAFGGLCVGVGIGYIVAEKRLVAQFEERLEKETEGMRTYYTTVAVKKYATPSDAVADLVMGDELDETPIYKNEKEDPREPAQKVAYHKVVKPLVDPEEELAIEAEFAPVVNNVFAKAQERDTSKPYIISQDEFMANDPEYTQATLTYYEKDDTLTDERDDIIDDRDKTTGHDAFASFGVDSSDENTVHVRNERLQMDFEIVRSQQSYSKEVLDIDEEPPIVRPSARMRREQGK